MPRPAASDRHWPAHDPYSSSGELSDPPHERPPISKTQKLLTRLSRNKDQTAHPSPAHHPELRRGTYPGESIHRDTNSHLPHEQFEVDERQHFIPGQDWRGTSEKKKWSKMRIVGIVMGVIFFLPLEPSTDDLKQPPHELQCQSCRAAAEPFFSVPLIRSALYWRIRQRTYQKERKT
ncbi:hypothetical protein JCM11641_001099 [Rhodosporidiobolus odoratus]